MDVDQAIAAGAAALFGEKYGDEVRVVTMGRARRDDGQRLLGRTLRRHACRAAPATSAWSRSSAESAVAAGVRRIEAQDQRAARARISNAEARALRDLAGLLRAPVEDAAARLAALLEERRKLERELTDARKNSRWAAAASGERRRAARSPA